MLFDRETKTFFAVLTLVGSAFLMVNHLVVEAPVEDWLLAGVLFVISVTLWFWLWSEQQATSTALVAVDEADALPRAQEWIISKEATTEVPAVEVDKMIAEKAESIAEIPSEIMEAPPAKIVPQPEPEPVKETAAEEEEAPAPVAEVEPEPAVEDDEPDDLTRIEGVGPKYRDALIDAGVSTFDQLAAMSLEAIEKLATDAGMRRSASMDTWAEQAALAAKGEWEALDALQEELSGGRR